MADFSRGKPSKNFEDRTGINPYIDYLLKILTSPTTSRQSTDYRQASDPATKNMPPLNPEVEDPRELLKADAKMDRKKYIQNWLLNDFLMKMSKQSQPGKFNNPYGYLPDGTGISR